MPEVLPQLYDVTYRDAEGEALAVVCFYRSPRVDVETQEREMRFLEEANELGAADYDVHLVRSNEIRILAKKARREAFVDRITKETARITGLDRMIELLPAMAVANDHELNT